MDSKKKRVRLVAAFSYDERARAGVAVVELRRNGTNEFFEKVIEGSWSSGSAVVMALSVARTEKLVDFDVLVSWEPRAPTAAELQEFGSIRFRKIKPTKTGAAKHRAYARLRELVPLPASTPDSYSLADLGIDLEIAELSREPVESLSRRNTTHDDSFSLSSARRRSR